MSRSTARKRGQVSVEFTVFMGLSIFVLLAFASVIAVRAISASNDQNIIALRETVGITKSEILLAASVSDGYLRNFTLPERLDGRKNYTITVMNRTIIGRLEDGTEISTRAVPTTGNVVKGENTIARVNGTVCINTVCA